MHTLLKTLAFCFAVLGAYGVGTWHSFIEPAKAEPPPPPRGLVISDEMQAQCDAEGGCKLISLEKAKELILAEAKRRAGNCMGSASHRFGES